ncbi:hypothetical protein C3744_20775 [Priestia megaterium]|uniref:Uncharacterized protein n=1 Tax=Priestia megaterium TaxID=1404 RepID=A0A3D8WY29_PRIMG|nr:hypothetical protein [Priestia megaterium]MDH3173657.1 hypothetical protein [Priestia megaterium]RDZ11498.1 hypothetical protein C3744_20775 [Priestia megaterium]
MFVILNRTESGLRNELNECLQIISTSLQTVKDNKSFNKVLAVQLRILLCDTKFGRENSLINKVRTNPMLKCINNNFTSYMNAGLIEFIQPEFLFEESNSSLFLEAWLNQDVIKSNVSYQSLDNCYCPYCGSGDNSRTSNSRNIQEVQNRECFIMIMCQNCGAKFPVNLDNIIDAYEGKIENVESVNITIRDIIKNYANKNGGAHIDSELDIKGLLIAELGGEYIQSISQYIVEYFSETEAG